ncbi:Fic family protein [Mariniluteicoccus flavus]
MPRGRPSRATVYARLDAAINELESRLGGLPSPKESEFIWADIWHLEAHHSTALEGNTLVLREVEALLDKGRAVGAKPLKEYMEVQGYADAARWVYAHALEPEWESTELISVTEIRRIHERAMAPVWQVAPHPEATEREAPGQFREHDIRPFPGGMTPPSWALVPARLRDWADHVAHLAPTLKAPRTSDTPLTEQLAQLHGGFEQVHPFIDGNGRTGRLVLNLILVRLGLPPVVVLKAQRPAYLAALQKSDDGDQGPLGEILARAMYDNLNRFIVPGVAGPARLVPLVALADERFSQSALRQAAQRGRLDAVQGADGVWRSSRKAVDDYARNKGVRSRHTRGAP